MHTTATDGKATLEEMVAAAQARGLQVHRDHRPLETRHAWPADSTPNGCGPSGTRSTSSTRSSRAFASSRESKCDILEKGGMDLEDDVLAEADWVVASVHYGQNQPREQITERILDALANPYVSAIAHPTGRLINRRTAVRSRPRRRVQGGREARQAAGAERQPRAARSGRRGLCRRQKPGHADRDLQRRPQHRRPGRAALRHLASPARGFDRRPTWRTRCHWRSSWR